MANTSFAVSMQRLVPWLSWHHFAMLFSVVVVLLLCKVILPSALDINCCSSPAALTLAGASRPSISNVYVLSLAYNKSTISQCNSSLGEGFSAMLHGATVGSRLEVRMGYFGLCFPTPAQPWLCSSDKRAVLRYLTRDADPLDLIRMGIRFQDVLFTGLV